jgi:hypothetical protein
MSTFDIVIVSVLPITVKGQGMPAGEGIAGERLDNIAELAIFGQELIVCDYPSVRRV